MIGVAAWLAATLDEVERMTLAFEEQFPALARFTATPPPIVRAGLEVDRAILALHELVPGEHYHRGQRLDDPRGCVICDEDDGVIVGDGPCETVLLVASRYRHLSGWREEWQP